MADLLPVKEKSSLDALIVAHSERDLLLQRPHVAKLQRSELEDQYLRLLEYSLQLKKHCNKQDEKIKRLATKLLQVVAQKKREVPLSVRRDSELQGTVAQQQQHIKYLEQTNNQLLERITVLRKQLTEHSTLHSAVHCNYPGSLHSSRSPSRHVASAARYQGRISSANSQNLFQSEVSSEQLPPNEDAEEHKAQCPMRGVHAHPHPVESQLTENVGQSQELEHLHTHISLLQQEMERQQHESNVRISELEEELANTNTLLQKQKVADNVELIQLKRSLQQATSKIKERNAHVDSLQEELSKLQGALEDARKQTDELRGMLSIENKRVGDLQDELNKLEQNAVRPETEVRIKDLEQECDMLKEVNLQLMESLKGREISEDVEKMRSEISDIVQKEVEDRLEKTKQIHQQEKSELIELTAAHDELLVKYNEIVNKHNEIEKRLKFALENPTTAQMDFTAPNTFIMKENQDLGKSVNEKTAAPEKQPVNLKPKISSNDTLPTVTSKELQTAVIRSIKNSLEDVSHTEDINKPSGVENKSCLDHKLGKENLKSLAQKSTHQTISFSETNNNMLSSDLSQRNSISDQKMIGSDTVGFKGFCLCGIVPVRLPKGFCLCSRHERPVIKDRRGLMKEVKCLDALSDSQDIAQTQGSSTKDLNSSALSSHTEMDMSDISGIEDDVTTSDMHSASLKQKEHMMKPPRVMHITAARNHNDRKMEEEICRLTSVETIDTANNKVAMLPGEDKEAFADRLKLTQELQTCRELLRVQHHLTSVYKKEVGILTEKINRNNIVQGNQNKSRQNKIEVHRKLNKQETTYKELGTNVEDVNNFAVESGLGGLFQIHMQHLELLPEGISVLDKVTLEKPRLFLTWTFYDKELSYTPVKKAAPTTELDSSSVHKVIINDEFLMYLAKEYCTIEVHAAVDDISTTIAAGKLYFSEVTTHPQNKVHATVHLILLDPQNKGGFGMLHCWFRLNCAAELVEKIIKLGKLEEVDKPKQKVPVPVPRTSKSVDLSVHEVLPKDNVKRMIKQMHQEV